MKITITQTDVDKFNELYFKTHPRARIKRIIGPYHPSLNWYMRANNMSRNAAKQNWKEFILFILDENGLRNRQLDCCEIIYTTYFKQKRIHDVDNITPKFILDGLVDGKFLIADDINHIPVLVTKAFYDVENPRIELEFIEKRRK